MDANARPLMVPTALATLRDMRYDNPCPHPGCNDCRRRDAAVEAVSDLIEEAGFVLRGLDAGEVPADDLAKFREALAACGVAV